MKRLYSSAILIFALLFSMTACNDSDPVVSFQDPRLESLIRTEIDKSDGDIYASDLESITTLEATKLNISDINGLEYCVNLTDLQLNFNQVSDISPLSELINLTVLYLSSNQVSDISALSELINLTDLALSSNQVSDISALSELINLTELYLASNQISDISALSGLVNLTVLYLSGNQISEIYPLVENSGIDSGDLVFLSDNQLSTTSCNVYIPELENRGVEIEHECL